MNSLLVTMTFVCVSTAAMAFEAQLVSNPNNLTAKEYTNPIIHADYSDPDVTASADGSTFYMTASSFQCTPGLPILKSTDLVNWELVNYALTAVPPVDVYAGAPKHGKGVWAPCLRCHNGEYFIYWGDPDYGVFMTSTRNPEGEWSAPVLVKAGKGIIDPTPLWDEDGKAYLANGWAASRIGFNSVITISEMTPDGKHVVGQPVLVYDGNDGVNHTVEGPKLYKRNGYYYLFAPAGGVATGWQLVMRSNNIYGPYECRTVMAQGATDINGPHQGALVDTPDGNSWFIHFQDKGAYGRVIHLNPVKWNNDWCVIGADRDGDGCGEPVSSFTRPLPASSATLSSHQGAGLFEWHGNYDDSFGFQCGNGATRIYGYGIDADYCNLWSVPNLWLEKFPAEAFTLTAKVKISAKQSAEGVTSGFVVMGWDYCAFAVTLHNGEFVISQTVCRDAEQGGSEHSVELARVKPSRSYSAGLLPNLERDLYVRVQVAKGAVCRFAYSLDGKRWSNAPAEFTARAGKWIGAKAGFYSITPADVHDRGWIDVENVDLKID